MALQLEEQVHYKYEGRNIDKMPELIKAGLVPIPVFYVLDSVKRKNKN